MFWDDKRQKLHNLHTSPTTLKSPPNPKSDTICVTPSYKHTIILTLAKVQWKEKQFESIAVFKISLT